MYVHMPALMKKYVDIRENQMCIWRTYACSSHECFASPRNTEVQQVLGRDVHTVHGSLEAAADLAQAYHRCAKLREMMFTTWGVLKSYGAPKVIVGLLLYMVNKGLLTNQGSLETMFWKENYNSYHIRDDNCYMVHSQKAIPFRGKKLNKNIEKQYFLSILV